MHLNRLLRLSGFFYPGELLPRNRGQFTRFCGLYSGEKLKLKLHYGCKHAKPPEPLSHLFFLYLLKCLIHINLVVALPVSALSHVGSGLARVSVQIFSAQSQTIRRIPSNEKVNVTRMTASTEQQ